MVAIKAARKSLDAPILKLEITRAVDELRLNARLESGPGVAVQPAATVLLHAVSVIATREPPRKQAGQSESRSPHRHQSRAHSWGVIPSRYC